MRASRRIFKRFIALLCLVCLLVVLGPPIAYLAFSWHLSLDALPRPSGEPAALFNSLMWRELGGIGPMRLDHVNPYSVIGGLHRAQVAPADRPAEARLTTYAVRISCSSHVGRRSIAVQLLEGAACYVWAGRHLSAHDVAWIFSATAHYGNGFLGLEDAARGYFGRQVGHLDDVQMAYLVVAAMRVSADPWCNEARATSLVHSLLKRADGVDSAAAGLLSVPPDTCTPSVPTSVETP
jgi:hypothetical protein